MAIKSLLRQATQIRASVSQSDVDLGTDNSDRNNVVTSASYLEEDLNNVRSMILDITGETLWSDKPQVTLADVAGTSNKLIFQPVQYSATGLNASADLVTDLDAPAGLTNTTNTEDLGYVIDDSDPASVDSKAKVFLRDKATNMPILDANERQIFAIASNDGNDKVKLTFYTDNDGTAEAVNVTGDIEALLPSRTSLADANENFAMVNAGFADKVGAFEIGDRVYTDVNDKDGNPIYGFVENEDLTATINKLADKDGADIKYTNNIGTVTGVTSDTFATTFATDGANYLADDDSYYSALEKLDAQIKTNEDAIANASADKVIEIMTESIAEGTAHTLPDSKTYKNDDKDAMDLYVNGQQVVSDAIAGGAGNGDYAESSTTEVTFNFPIEIGDVLTYKIYKA